MNDTIHIAFFGSPPLASACLAELHKSYQVKLVVTKPDARRGRGKKLSMTPVKEFALRNRIDVYQPQLLNGTLVDRFQYHDVNLTVVVAYGKILPEKIIYYPKLGSLNLHASLLPKYRGPSPIEAALLNGESVTGVTLQRMKEEIDTGDIISTLTLPIEPETTALDLLQAIVKASPPFLVKSIEGYLSGTLKPVPQIESKATYCSVIKKEDALICWNDAAETVLNKIRAYVRWPVAYSTLDNKLLKFFKARVPSLEDTYTAKTGTVVDVVEQEGIIVKTGGGIIGILELQPENRRRMGYREFFNGYRNLKGKILGQKG